MTMNASQKVSQLRNLIHNTLIPLIDHDFYLLEAPYYNNIGDTLIWQGEMDFLKLIPHKCKGVYSGDTFLYPEISKDDILLFQGGGNFGDLYPWNHDFKMDVIKHYPKNKTIIFPQTIWFEKEENLQACADFLSEHMNVIICARDQVSYNVFKERFQNKIIMLPDMAFCIDMEKWDIPDIGGRDLFLKRNDGELKSYGYMSELESRSNVDVTDWPTMLVKDVWQTKLLQRFKIYAHRSPRFFTCKVCDLLGRYWYRPFLINTGVKMLRSHNNIYTTRLHTAILSVLLEKKHIEFFDNSYGKNKNFYDTWLSDCDNIQLVNV